jgi:hypothetical protein
LSCLKIYKSSNHVKLVHMTRFPPDICCHLILLRSVTYMLQPFVCDLKLRSKWSPELRSPTPLCLRRGSVLALPVNPVC